MAEAIQGVSAVMTLVALAGTLVLLALTFGGVTNGLLGALRRLLTKHRLAFTFAISAAAMAGSLYFSEVAGYTPCRLCWFQRIAIYPIALISLVGLISKDRTARRYIVPLAAIGVSIAGYHWMLEQGWLSEGAACSATGVSCADVWFTVFGFLTFASMSFFAFVVILVFSLVPDVRSATGAALADTDGTESEHVAISN